jgi:hypothetical protein
VTDLISIMTLGNIISKVFPENTCPRLLDFLGIVASALFRQCMRDNEAPAHVATHRPELPRLHHVDRPVAVDDEPRMAPDSPIIQPARTIAAEHL